MQVGLARWEGADPFKTGSPPMPPLSWMPYGPWLGQFALVCCEAGHVCALTSKNHTVAPDGTLNPSLVCATPGCTWHVFARLERWP